MQLGFPETRCTRGEVRTERVFVKRRREAFPLASGPVAAAALVLRDQISSFRGGELVDVLGGFGFPRAEARAALLELLRAEVMYAPHAADA